MAVERPLWLIWCNVETGEISYSRRGTGGTTGRPGGRGSASNVTSQEALLKLIAIGMPVSRTGRGTVLTVRVRKSDAESFAKGKLTFDQFEQKATIAAYLGPASHGSSASFRGVSYPSRYPVPPVAR